MAKSGAERAYLTADEGGGVLVVGDWRGRAENDEGCVAHKKASKQD